MKKILFLTVCMVFLFAGFAKADSLQLGGTYTTINMIYDGVAETGGGGSIDVSYLNGDQLEYLYCVDYERHIDVSNTYTETVVTNNGTIYGSSLNNAGQVAWLLSNYGVGGNGDGAYALQAAIWHVVTEGTGHTLNMNMSHTQSTSTQRNLYTSYLTALGSYTSIPSNPNPSQFINQFSWITPGTRNANGTSIDEYQGLVGVTVPEPATMLLLGLGLVGLAGVRRKYKA